MLLSEPFLDKIVCFNQVSLPLNLSCCPSSNRELLQNIGNVQVVLFPLIAWGGCGGEGRVQLPPPPHGAL